MRQTGSPSSLLANGTPSPTAQWVATLRAVHGLLDEPTLLTDPLALRLLGPEEERAVRDNPFQYNDPFTRFLRAKVVVRTKLALDNHIRAIAAGIEQHVLLGAGLDTFAYGQAFSVEKLCIFEVDHPATQDWKKQRLSHAGIQVPENVTFLPCDFETEELPRVLAAAGFDIGKRTCISWLGVTPYLSNDSISSVLTFVANLPRGSSITFDFHTSAINPLERALLEIGADRVGAKGEYFKSSFDPDALIATLQHSGFSAVELWDPPKLNSMYLANRRDGLCTIASIASATV